MVPETKALNVTENVTFANVMCDGANVIHLKVIQARQYRVRIRVVYNDVIFKIVTKVVYYTNIYKIGINIVCYSKIFNSTNIYFCMLTSYVFLYFIVFAQFFSVFTILEKV